MKHFAKWQNMGAEIDPYHIQFSSKAQCLLLFKTNRLQLKLQSNVYEHDREHITNVQHKRLIPVNIDNALASDVSGYNQVHGCQVEFL